MTFQQQFEGKVIALTGAASGIALATAHLLASRGAKLSLADVSADALAKHAEDIRTKYSTEVISSAVDVRDYAQVEKWTNDTKKHFGKLDGAANLAGVIPKTMGIQNLEEQDMDDWNFVLGVNLNGVMHCMKAQLNAIEEGGSICNASSIAGLTGRDKNAAYSASKHGVLGLSRSAAKEVGERNVRVNCICPGRIETPMVEAATKIAATGPAEKNTMLAFDGIALRRGGQPEEVAKLIAFLLSSESSYVTGAAISIDGGVFC